MRRDSSQRKEMHEHSTAPLPEKGSMTVAERILWIRGLILFHYLHKPNNKPIPQIPSEIRLSTAWNQISTIPLSVSPYPAPSPYQPTLKPHNPPPTPQKTKSNRKEHCGRVMTVGSFSSFPFLLFPLISFRDGFRVRSRGGKESKKGSKSRNIKRREEKIRLGE